MLAFLITIADTVVGFVTQKSLSHFFGSKKKSESTDQIDAIIKIHDKSLDNAVKAKGFELELAQEQKDKARIQAEFDELKNRQANPEKSLQEKKTLIAELKDLLEDMLKTIIELGDYEILVGKLAIAKADLEKGYFSKTDEFFAEIEVDEGMSLQGAVRIAFIRAQIAEHEVRWNDAGEHYARAVKLNPCFDTLIRAQKFAIDVGDYPSALSLGLRTQKVAIADHGEESKEHAIILNNIAGIFLEYRDGKKAEPLFNKALKINKELFGENHPDTASNINSLGGAYEVQEDYEKAESFYQYALKIYRKDFDKNRTHIATGLNNLGSIYRIQKKYKKAETFHKEALSIRRDALGDNHPDTAGSLNHLGGVYRAQKLYKEAKPMFEQALEVYEATLGIDHPITKVVKKNHERNNNDITNAENGASQ